MSFLHDFVSMSSADELGTNAVIGVEPEHAPGADRRIEIPKRRAVPIAKLRRVPSAVRPLWIDEHILNSAAAEYPRGMCLASTVRGFAILGESNYVELPAPDEKPIQIVLGLDVRRAARRGEDLHNGVNRCRGFASRVHG